MTTENDVESGDWVTDLQNALNRYFSNDELEALCLSLGLDYEGLPGESKKRKVVELIQYMVRTERVDQLIQTCGKVRDNVNWEGMLAAAKANPLRLESAFTPSVAAETPAGAPLSAVPRPSAAPRPLQSVSGGSGLLRNKWVLAGIGGVVLIFIVIAFIASSLGSVSADLGVKQERVDMLLTEVQITGQRGFEADAAGWQVASPQALSGEDFNLTVRPENSLIRSRSFGPGDAIIIDFELPQLTGGTHQVEFVLQSGEDRETAAGLIVAEVGDRVAATAVFNGETVTPTSFDRNLALDPDYLYSAMLAVAEDGKILVTVWDDFEPNLHSTFVYNPGPEWANSDWRVSITTPPNGEAVLDEWWDLTFNATR